MTAEREAWFQGGRVQLDLNAEAAVQLRDALDRVARSEPTSGAALAPLDVRLPVGRPLRVSDRLTDAGTIRGPDGTYRSSQAVAYVDVSGDFDTHVAPDRSSMRDASVPRGPCLGTGGRRARRRPC